jgi:hypothetical protein
MNTTQQIAPVVELGQRALRTGGGPRRRLPNLIVLTVALALACSPLAFGYYDFTSWAPLGIGALVLLVMLAFGPSPRVTRHGAAAAGGLGLMLVLSFASLLWAESRDSAWTSANQIAVYAVVFAIGALAIREHRTARATMLVLGLPALISAVALAVEIAGGGGAGAFLQGRLDTPVGYINGTAGLLVMGDRPGHSSHDRGGAARRCGSDATRGESADRPCIGRGDRPLDVAGLQLDRSSAAAGAQRHGDSTGGPRGSGCGDDRIRAQARGVRRSRAAPG